MTEADLTRIEGELGITLPGHYREFVLSYPQSLRDAKLDLGHAQEPACETYLFADPEAVIEANQSMRAPGLLVVDGETAPWPPDHLIVGKDVGGNCWCITLSGRSKAVWYFDHEEGGFEKESRSLADHERRTLKFIAEFNAGK